MTAAGSWDSSTAVADLRRAVSPVALAHLLAALAIAAAVGGLWHQYRVYESHRGQNLDMPEWFVINVDLTVELAPVMVLGGLLTLSSAMMYTVRPGTRVLAIVSFTIVWSWAAFLVGLLVYSRVPG